MPESTNAYAIYLNSLDPFEKEETCMENETGRISELQYRDFVRRSIDENGWSDDLETRARRALNILREGRKNELAPNWLRAAFSMTRTLLFIVAPLFLLDGDCSNIPFYTAEKEREWA